MELKLFYPFKPFIVTQQWGALNPMYSAQFSNPDFKRHNGLDANVGYTDVMGRVNTEYPVYCPAEGFRVSEVAYYPEGGGWQIGLVSKQKLQIGDKLCYVSLLLCHAKKILAKVGDEPKLGELIMIADNTGFSTGLHTHIGMYRLNDKFQKIDSNEATGSYNPQPFFTGAFAIDAASPATQLRAVMRYYYEYLKGGLS